MTDSVLKVDGFGGMVSAQGAERIAADLAALGVPAESFGMLRRSEPGSEGWVALIGDAKVWFDVLGAAGGAILAAEKVVALSARLLAALGRQERHVVGVRVPYPWDDLGLYGASAEISLAPGECVDGFQMWLDRVQGVERALLDIREHGHQPLGNVGCLLSASGFRLRWANSRGFERHEADYALDGTRKGVIRRGWTDEPSFQDA